MTKSNGIVNPQPRLARHRNTHSVHYQPNFSYNETFFSLKVWGYLILIGTWSVSLISIGCMFNFWSWFFALPGLSAIAKFFFIPQFIFAKFNFPYDNNVVDHYYVYIFFLNFVVMWIWCVISWISMKLFRHSKGSG